MCWARWGMLGAGPEEDGVDSELRAEQSHPLKDERNTGSPGKTTSLHLTKRERKHERKDRNRTSRTNITMITVSGPEEPSKEDILTNPEEEPSKEDIRTNPEEIRKDDEPLRECRIKTAPHVLIGI
ncbi:hypothetical protein NDU88_007886 [Pleurodeles waltl]|uniref:Uncharacterized protein n=1 Tax=Pleurodeles waltl TaxID=8319 RepID=A0AAV7RQQ0_PLEWA|nr:hypothetical protein NDU88_007886 [Pleurodeles waltl]